MAIALLKEKKSTFPLLNKYFTTGFVLCVMFPAISVITKDARHAWKIKNII